MPSLQYPLEPIAVALGGLQGAAQILDHAGHVRPLRFEQSSERVVTE
jgi:hypothetical protein